VGVFLFVLVPWSADLDLPAAEELTFRPPDAVLNMKIPPIQGNEIAECPV